MALVKAGHTASVVPAVQRREQLLRTHVLPNKTQADEKATPSTAQSASESTVSSTSESAVLSSIAKEPLSRSQEIAKEVLAEEATVDTTVKDTSKTGSSTSVKTAAIGTTSGGGGGPESPIYVTIAERAFKYNYSPFLC